MSDDYQIIIGTEEGEEVRYGSTAITMSGNIAGDPSSKATVVINRNFFFASIKDGEETTYYEPLNLYQEGVSADKMVVYKASDVIEVTSTCAAKVVESEMDRITDRTKNTSRAGACYEVEYAVASDFEMYKDFSSNASAVENFVIFYNRHD